MRHSERSEDFPLAEAVKAFVGQPFESDAEEDESNIAVVGVAAGIGG